MKNKWIDVRELPDAKKSVTFYIQSKNIEVVSVEEDEDINDESCHIFLSTLENKYLHGTFENSEQAHRNAKHLIDTLTLES